MISLNSTATITPSWLIYPVVNYLFPKEQVGKTTEVVSEVIVSPLLTSPILEHPVPQKEVIPKPQETVIPQEEVIPEPQENPDTNLDHVASVDVPNRYELPPKSTRGILLRRYDPEFEA